MVIPEFLQASYRELLSSTLKSFLNQIRLFMKVYLFSLFIILFFNATAFITAILYFFPILFPFLSPRKRETTCFA
jgi:hypothetical protein